MRHGKVHRKFSRKAEHRRAMFANMAERGRTFRTLVTELMMKGNV